MEVRAAESVLQASIKVNHTQALLVVGMHRSGTSAVTRVLNLLGASLPTNLMIATPEVNPTGFWESYDVADFNDALLAACGATWDQVLLCKPADLPAVILEKFDQSADHLLQKHFSSCTLFALKDPRIGRLLPFWLKALQRNSINANLVIVVRHPLEVADSLARRDGFSVEKSLYLWLRHMVDSIRFSSDSPSHIVVYQELLQDWRKSVSDIKQGLGIAWLHSYEEVAPALEQFLNANLRHHRHDRGNLYTRGKIGHLAAVLYSALLVRSSGLTALAETLHEELLEIEQLVQALSNTGQLVSHGTMS